MIRAAEKPGSLLLYLLKTAFYLLNECLAKAKGSDPKLVL